MPGTIPATREYQAYGCSVQATTQGEHVLDVKVLVNHAQRARFLKHFKQRTLSTATESYTGLVQRELTSYFYDHTFRKEHTSEEKTESKEEKTPEKKVHALMQGVSDSLKPFAHLERRINNASSIEGDNNQRLETLTKEIKTFEESLFNIVDKLEDQRLPNVDFRDLRGEFKNKLTANVKSFCDYIDSLKNRPYTATEIQQLFCSQSGAIDLSTSLCLGSFLTEQLTLLIDYGIAEVCAITDQRITLINTPDIKALSDAKAGLELRTLSAKGAREENNQTPVPSDLLDLIHPQEKTGVDEEKEGEKKWLSLAPYVTQFQDIEEIDKMVFVLSDQAEDKPFFTSSKKELLSWGDWFYSKELVAVEFLGSLVYVAYKIISFALDVVCVVLGAIPVSIFSWIANHINSYLGRDKRYAYPKWGVMQELDEKAARLRSELLPQQGVWFYFKLLFFNVGEFFVSSGHVFYNLVSFALEVSYIILVNIPGSILCWIANSINSYLDWPKRYPYVKWGVMQELDEWVTQQHGKLSQRVLSTKGELRERYVNKKEGQDQEQAFLSGLYENKIAARDSSVNQFISAYSGHKLGAIVVNFLKSLGGTIKNVWSNIKFMFWEIWLLPEEAQKARQEAFTSKQEQVRTEYAALLAELGNQLTELANKVQQVKETATQAQAEEKKREAKSTASSEEMHEVASTTTDGQLGHAPIASAQQNKQLDWLPGTPWTRKEFYSIFDVPSEIMNVLADSLVDKMFRHNPGPSTLYFMFSVASFTTLMIPALAANSKTAWLGAPSNFLSKHIWGQVAGVENTFFIKSMSVFLQWKASILATELSVEIAHGNIDFIRKFFKDADKIFLILAFLLAISKGLEVFGKHSVPLVDFSHWMKVDPNAHPLLNGYLNVNSTFLNTLPALFNEVGEDAVSCSSNGSIWATWIEKSLVSLKLCFVLHSVLNAPQRASVLNAAEVAKNLAKKWHPGMNSEEARKLLQEQGINEPLYDVEARAHYNTMITVICDPHVGLGSSTGNMDTGAGERKEESNSSSNKKLKEAREKLESAMSLVRNMECLNSSGFKDKGSAWHFSDYVSDCFDEYIENLEKVGKPTGKASQIKQYYLASFANKYCSINVLPLFRFFSVLPFWPLTLLWRGLRYALSLSPSVQNEVIRSCKKDIAMFFQLATAVARLVRAALHAVGSTLKYTFVALVLLVSIPELILYGDRWKKIVFITERTSESLSGLFEFHRLSIPGWSWLKAWYANWTNDCNVSQGKDYLHHWDTELDKLLKKNEECERNPGSVRRSSHADMQEVFSQHTKSSSSYWSSSTPAGTFVEQALEVEDSSLSESTKKTHFHTIFARLEKCPPATRVEVARRLGLAASAA